MNKKPQFYQGRICLNVLANSLENAKECYEAAEGNVVLGVLSKNYATDAAALKDMAMYQKEVNNALSIGLGAGDPNQSGMVTRLAKELHPQHVNQVFTGAGTTRCALGQNETFVNALVSPTGKVGYVNIATGPLSSLSEPTEIPVATAIALLKDMGASSIKYFPMKGIKHIDEFKFIAQACAENDFALEPTGGIDLDNFEEIIQIAYDAGVKEIIPHVYSSIINPETKNTNPEDVKTLMEIVKKVVKK
ncbi:2-dehydro-3-deoxy-phosphogluconate aldolase [Granulicatella balaenopterae]|nr:KDGP aldolase family protein [Granulicatella balaenopterae]